MTDDRPSRRRPPRPDPRPDPRPVPGGDADDGLDPHAVLAECRRRFGPAPRRFEPELRAKLKWPFHLWMLWDGPFRRYRSARRRLLREGEVVWGALVQANMMMFDPDLDFSCPGEVVFCPDARRPVHPDELIAVARRVGELKHTAPRDAELRKFADYLTDEHVRAFGWPIPRKLTGGLPCVDSTVLFPRDHLPGRAIYTPVMPLVVLPTEPHYACVLHGGFWPRAYREAWVGG